jgi:hypothetical protein
MNTPNPLTASQRDEAKAICDVVCERLRTDEDYSYDLARMRGMAGSFLDEVWDEAVRMLQVAGWNAKRNGAVISVSKRS